MNQINTLKYLNLSNIIVNVDLASLSRDILKVSSATWKHYNNGKYGSYLPGETYIKYKNILPQPKLIYANGSKGRAWIKPIINLDEFAYLYGFWLGDGWVNETRVNFAIENKFVDFFVNYLKNLSFVEWQPKIRSVRDSKGSKEVRCSNSLMVDIFRGLAEEKPKCSTKYIHKIWSETNDNVIKLLIKGMIDSDGCLSKKSRNRNRMYYKTTSITLANDLKRLLNQLNINSGISIQPPRKGGIINGRQIIGKNNSYCVHWSANKLDGYLKSLSPERIF